MVSPLGLNLIPEYFLIGSPFGLNLFPKYSLIGSLLSLDLLFDSFLVGCPLSLNLLSSPFLDRFTLSFRSLLSLCRQFDESLAGLSLLLNELLIYLPLILQSFVVLFDAFLADCNFFVLFFGDYQEALLLLLDSFMKFLNFWHSFIRLG
jgi:hypothetical protein